MALRKKHGLQLVDPEDIINKGPVIDAIITTSLPQPNARNVLQNTATTEQKPPKMQKPRMGVNNNEAPTNKYPYQDFSSQLKDKSGIIALIGFLLVGGYLFFGKSRRRRTTSSKSR